MRSERCEHKRSPRTNSADPALDDSMQVAHDLVENTSTGPPRPKPIVSVNGHDVAEEEIETNDRKGACKHKPA